MTQRIGQVSRNTATATLAVVAVVALCLAGCEQQRSRGAVANVDAAQKLRDQLDSGGTGPVDKPKQQRTGWATLKGTITVVGDPPARPFLKVDKNVDVCAPGGQKPLAEAFVVDPQTKGFANVFFYTTDLKAADDMVHPDMVSGPVAELLLDQKACAFTPHAMVVITNKVVTLKNSDPVAHNSAFKGGPDTTVQGGATGSYTPTRAKREPVPVSCGFHSWMKAYVLPLDNAYGDVTATDGSFEIKNLPAGVDLRIQAWHEELKKKFPGASVTVNGQSATLDKRGRLSLKLEPDQTTTVNIELPAAALN
jgi:hypothetical protein